MATNVVPLSLAPPPGPPPGPPAARLDAGVVVGGRYTLERPLAQGGMGSVWVATHRGLEIEVAVKLMAPSLLSDAGARARFEREAKAVARLRSQHVVQVLDYGVEHGEPYLVMELLRGETLAARIKRAGRLPLATVAPIAVQIAKALATAHEAGLVHRDLKPANVFLARKDGDEVVQVVDFGIAKANSLGGAASKTVSGTVLGSLPYMSPEQVRSARSVDHRADLWALAVILYRALTGALPFPNGEVLAGTWSLLALTPCVRAPGLPPAADAFFARAFAAKVEDRFPTARAFADAFSAIASGAAPLVIESSTVVLGEALPAARAPLFTMPLPDLLPEGGDDAPPTPSDAASSDTSGRNDLRRRLVPGELSASEVRRVIDGGPAGRRARGRGKREPSRSRVRMAVMAFVILVCTGLLSATALRLIAPRLARVLPSLAALGPARD